MFKVSFSCSKPEEDLWGGLARPTPAAAGDPACAGNMACIEVYTNALLLFAGSGGGGGGGELEVFQSLCVCGVWCV
jgi:hypothetical protein